MKVLLTICAICTLPSFPAIGQDSSSTTTNELKVVCCPPYEKYTVPGGEQILAWLALLGYRDIESFQRKNGLVEDGIVGPITSAAVHRELKARGLPTSVDSANVIGLQIAEADGELFLVISNRTDRLALFLDDGPLVYESKGFRELRMPISAVSSGKSKTGASIRAGSRSDVRFLVPVKVSPNTAFSKPVESATVGPGTSVVKAKVFLAINSNRVELVESRPLNVRRFIDLKPTD